MTCMTTTQQNGPCPGGDKIYNFTIYEPCPRVEEKIFFKKKHFHSGHLEFWLINTLYLLVWSMPGSRKEDFQLMYFHYKTYVATL